MVLDLGLVDYEEAYGIQKEFVCRRKLGEIDDSVIMAEHRPIFTMGRNGRRENLLVAEDLLRRQGIKVLRVDRGGDITFHGPGQLVLYPIIDLRLWGKDIHKYLRSLEEVAIRILRDYSISAVRREGKTGVWADEGKVSFIGIAASNWVTYHGLSINVNVDLNFFSMIHPCGMKGIEIMSMSRSLGRDIEMREVKERALSHLDGIFGLTEDIFEKRVHSAVA